MLPFLALALCSLVGTAFSSTSTPDFKSRCEALSGGVDVRGYENISFSEGTNSTCTFPNPVTAVDLCRVGIRFSTSDSSEVYMEAWLPEKWNSRLLSIGTGGLAGCIFFPELAYVTKYGFAGVSGNMGHNGTSGGAFLNQPEVFIDFAWRALYGTTVISKSIAKQFYGTAHKKSYFIGCSQGGRQGFKAAQSNPELFDGIVVGAPGLRLAGLFQYIPRWLRTMGTDINNLTVSIDKWAAIQNETLRQCDHLDGAVDNIVEDSRSCKPDFTKLRCGTQGLSGPCLTPVDMSLVSQQFESWTINGTLIYTGMTHDGNELAHATTLTGPEFRSYALEWPRFVSQQDPTWTLDQWTPAQARFAVEQNLFNFNTLDGDLKAVRKRGAKIIHYHGQVDPAIDSTVSDAYYDHVSRTMRASPQQLDDFYRYFRISGLGHCNGGPGASSIGQSAFSLPASDDAKDNVLMQIVDWVEKGKAPDTLRGSKFVDGDVTKGVEYKRRHCRYPLKNVYTGEGDGKDEKGWKCVV
ncbi:feruloyl esterase B [Ophiobolus disseminans]|uniref:Carboxylic ester hydrolase n=1 Tax=Ophiobolus disseminans TaxID=1469910 RepID=A0A6A6ZLP4_9PLEO|nr:feruloyl esterase B [Ophiobolus disseminans]